MEPREAEIKRWSILAENFLVKAAPSRKVAEGNQQVAFVVPKTECGEQLEPRGSSQCPETADHRGQT
jgi:hypothetical protein